MKTFEEVHAVLTALKETKCNEELLTWFTPLGEIHIELNVSDFFMYGIHDRERIEVEDLVLLRKCYAELKAAEGPSDFLTYYTPYLLAFHKRGYEDLPHHILHTERLFKNERLKALFVALEA